MSARTATGVSIALYYVGLGLVIVGVLRFVNRSEGPLGPALLALGALAIGAGITLAHRARRAP